MLFLYRPRETRMPFRRGRPLSQQQMYNQQLQQKFEATRRVPPVPPRPPAPPPPPGAGHPNDVVGRLKDLDALHRSGALNDAEFASAKAMVLSDPAGT
jgi:hypothetical protein